MATATLGLIHNRRRRQLRERAIELLLFLAAFSSVLVTTAIVVILVWESLSFFAHVPVLTFLTDTMWTPLFAQPRYGILPLLCGTLLSTAVALTVAVPLGLVVAVYLSEFAPTQVREAWRREPISRSTRPRTGSRP
jgi:phosphate transport system permease protein